MLLYFEFQKAVSGPPVVPCFENIARQGAITLSHVYITLQNLTFFSKI